jgi:hypothetical protein
MTTLRAMLVLVLAAVPVAAAPPAGCRSGERIRKREWHRRPELHHGTTVLRVPYTLRGAKLNR